MKKSKTLFAVIIVLFAFLISGCGAYQIKHLNKNRIDQASTALIIDTEFFGSMDEPYNGFNIKCENDMTTKECDEIMTRLKQAEGTQRTKLITELAALVIVAFNQKGIPSLGLDKNKFFDSKQFPLKYSGDNRTYCGVSRDYSDLAKKGYTHVLHIGFPNRIIYKKRITPTLFFGVEVFLLDVRPESGDITSRANRIQRQEWCYHITPTMQMQATSSTASISTRNCLGIALLRSDAAAYTLDELFTGPDPVYFELYKGAALYGLTFATRHLKGGTIYPNDVKASVDADEFIAKLNPPAK